MDSGKQFGISCNGICNKFLGIRKILEILLGNICTNYEAFRVILNNILLISDCRVTFISNSAKRKMISKII